MSNYNIADYNSVTNRWKNRTKNEGEKKKVNLPSISLRLTLSKTENKFSAQLLHFSNFLSISFLKNPCPVKMVTFFVFWVVVSFKIYWDISCTVSINPWGTNPWFIDCKAGKWWLATTRQRKWMGFGPLKNPNLFFTLSLFFHILCQNNKKPGIKDVLYLCQYYRSEMLSEQGWLFNTCGRPQGRKGVQHRIVWTTNS